MFLRHIIIPQLITLTVQLGGMFIINGWSVVIFFTTRGQKLALWHRLFEALLWGTSLDKVKVIVLTASRTTDLKYSAPDVKGPCSSNRAWLGKV